MSTCAPYARNSSCDVPYSLKSLVLSPSIDSMGLIFTDLPFKHGEKFLPQRLIWRSKTGQGHPSVSLPDKPSRISGTRTQGPRLVSAV